MGSLSFQSCPEQVCGTMEVLKGRGAWKKAKISICSALTKVWSLFEPELPLLHIGTWGESRGPRHPN